MSSEDTQEPLERIQQLEKRVRKLSEEKANLYLVLHMVELLNPIAGVESLLETLMTALCGSLGGSNVEIYYLDEEQIHYANLFGERQVIEQIDDELVKEVFNHHRFIEQPTDSQHTMLLGSSPAIACTWVMPLLVGKVLMGVIKMSDMLGSAQMRDYLAPFFSHMALILSNEIKTRIAETANKAKSSFLATMSHEIRTPLNGILGMAQLLTLPECNPDKHQDYARTILSSGQTLLTLLNDVLDLSKIEANRLELVCTPVYPAEIIAEVQRLFLESAHQKNLHITTEWLGPAEQAFLLDQVRIRQMLSNLLNNAIKFTHQGTIEIQAKQLSRDQNSVELEFSVKDQGIGIASENQALLFKPFTQIDGSSTRRYAGTGLGLSIVQRFAELMQGEAGVDSISGQGARFWFRIRGNIADVSPKTLPATCIDAKQTILKIPQDESEYQPEMTALQQEYFHDHPSIDIALAELDNLLTKNLFQAVDQYKILQNQVEDSCLAACFVDLSPLIADMKFEQARIFLQVIRRDLTQRALRFGEN